MANTDRQQNIDIKELLVRHGREIPFVQVLRLLRFMLLSSPDSRVTYDNIFEKIRIRPELSLNFPGTDVVAVEQLERRKKHLYRVTVSFMGLYGSSAPLPTFYTEDLIEERREDCSITRDFIDIVNHPFYRHYFDIWEKYAVGPQLAENPDGKVYEFLYSLLGLSGSHARTSLPHSRKFLAYIGIAGQRPRSASGLRSILADILRIDAVEVEQCVPTFAQIRQEQLFLLGEKNSTLGEDAHVGLLVSDMTGKFRIHVGPLDGDHLQKIIPDTVTYKLLCECVQFYLDQPLIWDVQLKVEQEDIQTSQPGNADWGKLGWNTWLFSGEHIKNPGIVPLVGSNAVTESAL